MKTQTTNLGKVAITVEKDYWNINKEYDKLVVVEVENGYRSYISRKDVPAGIDLNNRDYWIPFSKLPEQNFNMYFATYTGNKETTRLQVPIHLRRKGLYLTYVEDDSVITEWYANSDISDEAFIKNDNWRYGSNMLVGDITISSDGYWIINDIKTTSKAQGDPGQTPKLRLGYNNKIQVTYDNDKWTDISDVIVPQYRWYQHDNNTAGCIQISWDSGNSWIDLSNDITNLLKIKGYVNTKEELPENDSEGSIYLVGPKYNESDEDLETPIYDMWIYCWKDDKLQWNDNGSFNSIKAGIVQDLGDSTTEIISQAGITNYINAMINAIIENNQTLYPLEMTVTGNNGPYEKGIDTKITLNIKIKYKNIVINSSELDTEINNTKIINGEFSETINDNTTYNITSTYTYNYLNKLTEIHANKIINIVFVNPCWFGFNENDSMSNIIINESTGFTKYIKTTPNGTYTLINDSDKYLWLCVPNTMSIKKVTMSGFDFPIEELNDENNEEYKYYRSSNKLKQGNYTIVIS